MVRIVELAYDLFIDRENGLASGNDVVTIERSKYLYSRITTEYKNLEHPNAPTNKLSAF